MIKYLAPTSPAARTPKPVTPTASATQASHVPSPIIATPEQVRWWHPQHPVMSENNMLYHDSKYSLEVFEQPLTLCAFRLPDCAVSWTL